MTMENRVRNRWKWSDHNVTVSAYVPKDVYERLVEMADRKTAMDGKYCSVSALVREIVERAVDPEE